MLTSISFCHILRSFQIRCFCLHRYHFWRVNLADFFTGYLASCCLPSLENLIGTYPIHHHLHPNLLTRRVLLALLVLVFSILSLAPFARTQRKINSPGRVCFWHIRSDHVDFPAYTRPTLVKRLGALMDKGRQRLGQRARTSPLCSPYWIILIAGCSADWALKKYCGGNPDEVLYASAPLHSNRSD